MALYKFFLFRDGQLVNQAERHCSDHLDALDAARALCRDYVIEVYSDFRFVARVKERDAALNAMDATSL